MVALSGEPLAAAGELSEGLAGMSAGETLFKSAEFGAVVPPWSKTVYRDPDWAGS